jgi:hypothetical protein
MSRDFEFQPKVQTAPRPSVNPAELSESAVSLANEALNSMRLNAGEFEDSEVIMCRDDSSQILLEMSQSMERAARLLKIAAVINSLSFVGMVECPQCGEEFHAGSYKSTKRKDW